MANPLARLTSLIVPKRRAMQFSLGTVFVGVTLVCLWLAWCVERARRQRTAVTELHRLHVAVLYSDPSSGRSEPGVASFGERLLGLAYREPVEYVGFQHAARLFDDPRGIKRALALLADIRGPKRLSLEGVPITDSDLLWLKPLTELRKLNLMYTDVTEQGVAELRQALPDCEIVQ